MFRHTAYYKALVSACCDFWNTESTHQLTDCKSFFRNSPVLITSRIYFLSQRGMAATVSFTLSRIPTTESSAESETFHTPDPHPRTVGHTVTLPIQVYFLPSSSEIVSVGNHISRITDIYFEKAKLCVKTGKSYSLRFFRNFVILSCQEIFVLLSGK
jgi:hypothetical protein